MANITYTRNLRLRLSSNLTDSARYNLERIDAVVGNLPFIALTDSVSLRSRNDITLDAESGDVGGSGTGGTVYIGDAARSVAEGSTDLPTNVVITAISAVLTDGVVTGEIVSTTKTATLTNKTIDADSNTIINIRNVNVAADAAIVESKLALDFSTATLNAADAVLQNNIDAEAITRAAADIVLQDNIDSEALTRANADIALASIANAHIARTDNPHSVTRAQLDAQLNIGITVPSAGDVGRGLAVVDTSGNVDWVVGPGSATVAVSSDDTTVGWLEDKVIAGTGISIATLSSGDAETLEITNSDTGSAAVSTHEGAYNHANIPDTPADPVDDNKVWTASGGSASWQPAQAPIVPEDLTTSTPGVNISGTGATLADATIDIDTASAGGPGLLSDTDWSTFNSKQDAITPADISGTTSRVSVTGGMGATLEAVSIDVDTDLLPSPISSDVRKALIATAANTAEWSSRAYTAELDWSGSGPCTMTISGSTHEQGVSPIVKVRETSTGVSEDIIVGVSIDDSTGNITLTASSNPVGYVSIIYGGEAAASPPALTSTLLLHFDNTGSATVIDAKGHTPTYTDMPQSASDPMFGVASADLDGTDQYVEFQEATDFAFGTGDFTIDMWVKPAANVSNGLFQLDDGSGGNYLYSHLADVGGAVNLIVANTPDGGTVTDIDTEFTVGAWNHIAFTRASGTLRQFVNGTQVASQAWTINYSDTTRCRVINLPAGLTGFTGLVDEFRIIKGTAAWTSGFTPPVAPYAA